jgi:flagellar basal-body rod protein FlgG
MLQGLYSAAAGMAAQQQRLDSISNDLANVSTTGYKSLRVGFRDLLYNSPGAQAGPTVGLGAGAAVETLGRSQAQGAPQSTGNPLDVAIQGDGYLQVRRADGTIALTRDGGLQLDSRGRLATADGDLVQPPIAVPPGTSPSDVVIGADGTVRANNRTVGRIGLVTVRATDRLQSIGNSLYAPTAASGAPRATTAATTLKQGALEGSNVDMGDSMVDMIDAQRTYSLVGKAIQTQDQMLAIANQVKP